MGYLLSDLPTGVQRLDNPPVNVFDAVRNYYANPANRNKNMYVKIIIIFFLEHKRIAF